MDCVRRHSNRTYYAVTSCIFSQHHISLNNVKAHPTQTRERYRKNASYTRRHTKSEEWHLSVHGVKLNFLSSTKARLRDIQRYKPNDVSGTTCWIHSMPKMHHRSTLKTQIAPVKREARSLSIVMYNEVTKGTREKSNQETRHNQTKVGKEKDSTLYLLKSYRYL